MLRVDSLHPSVMVWSWASNILTSASGEGAADIAFEPYIGRADTESDDVVFPLSQSPKPQNSIDFAPGRRSTLLERLRDKLPSPISLDASDQTPGSLAATSNAICCSCSVR